MTANLYTTFDFLRGTRDSHSLSFIYIKYIATIYDGSVPGTELEICDWVFLLGETQEQSGMWKLAVNKYTAPRLPSPDLPSIVSDCCHIST